MAEHSVEGVLPGLVGVGAASGDHLTRPSEECAFQKKLARKGEKEAIALATRDVHSAVLSALGDSVVIPNRSKGPSV
jgi:hypothetical protein